MTKQLKLKAASTAAVLITALPALAGSPAQEVVAKSHCNGDWCSGLKGIGNLYSNDDAKFIQKVKLFGRLHAQYAYTDGEDVNGDDFSEGFDDLRRLRLGAEVKFLNHFILMGRANFATDDARSGDGRTLGFQDWDELKLTYTRKNMLGFDQVSASYGRHKVGVGAEARESSKKLRTVERTAISNKVFDNRYTGILLNAKKGDWSGTAGYLSLDETDAIGNFDHGNAFYLLSEHKLATGNLSFDFFYNLDADGTDGDEVFVGYEWAATAAYLTTVGSWNLDTQIVFGDNGGADYQGSDSRTGNFWGVIIEPSKFIIEDKLEFVARYSYQGSEEDEGIRSNSRYARGDHGGNVNGGRGDSHHSIYAGLNYHFCGHNSKLLVGVEYEDLDTPNGDVEATTLWSAYRIHF